MTCEFKMFRALKKQGWNYCAKPAYYIWHGSSQMIHVPMCKEHGELVAGNLTNELERINAESL